MLKLVDAERIVAEELEARGHRVLRVDILMSIHQSQQAFPCISAICLGEPKLYDHTDVETVTDETALRTFMRDHWAPSAR